MFLAFIIALIGALLFSALSLPIPWLIGPIFSVLIAQFFIKDRLRWPATLRNTGLIIVGVAIGQQFDFALFSDFQSLMLFMVIVNILLFLFCLGIAWGISRTTGLTFKTAVAANVPGGLSQLVLFAEEEGDVNLTAVTYFHIVRVLGVVLLIPFLVSGNVAGGASIPLTMDVWQVVLLIILSAALVPIGQKLKLPVAHFLTPIIVVIALKLFSIDTPTMPSDVLHIAQLLIGTYIGLLLKPATLRLPAKVLVGGVLSTIAMIVLTYGTSLLIAEFLNLSFATSFLSTAPGGLDQMGLLAAAVKADISVVTVFQLFRLLFIFLCILPLIKWIYREREKELS
ncbi:AbrB family transcriptional regulator [Solibacillus merdavium]|uniref:AbrB family transcriptional regulator n=1 Tax=Solibacillus merdavium TaxID=2762218 RepID=A0ABR8XLD5_9BACL|nr:AbrB family transcriptional regulator [Solibacillus merdavium]MBD8032730.1 AbrB family transcriptional regulator [Solibacillus merdavium]